MTEIEKRALALVNEVLAEWGVLKNAVEIPKNSDAFARALFRAIEQHEAYKQEVSDAVEEWHNRWVGAGESHSYFMSLFSRFIIQPVDPLVDAFDAVWPGIDKAMVEALRTTLAARGGRIVFDQPEGGAA